MKSCFMDCIFILKLDPVGFADRLVMGYGGGGERGELSGVTEVSGLRAC